MSESWKFVSEKGFEPCSQQLYCRGSYQKVVKKMLRSCQKINKTFIQVATVRLAVL